MSADDILYAPITPDPATGIIDQALITQIALCLGDPNASVNFQVDPKFTLVTFQRITEIIEYDHIVFKAAQQFCAANSSNGVNFRPPNAATMKTVFETLYADPMHRQFYWTAKGSIHGVMAIEFLNSFSIVSGLPTVRMNDGMDYEWWMLGLMSNFAGYNGYYAFLDQQNAQNYWKTP